MDTVEQAKATSPSDGASPSLEKPAEPVSLANTRICDLGLKLEGSDVERFVQQLHRELEEKKIKKFKPSCYLTDEWGCPSGEPIIGVPFYLARKDLAQIEAEHNDLEDRREIMKYLRHEAGHAFNYAYRLHRTPEWKQLFGPYRRPYRRTIGRCCSQRSTFDTCRDGTRRNILMRTSPKPLPCG